MPVPPETASTGQQIQMKHVCEGAVQACQSEASLQQRNIKRRTVVGDHHFEPLQQVAKGQQHRRLFIEIADEILRRVEVLAFEVTEADKKWNHARTTLNARGLRIE